MKTTLIIFLCLLINFAYAQWSNSGDNQTTGNLTIGSTAGSSYSKFSILGPNTPADIGSKRDISFEFAAAGNSIIRSYRGGSWDTYLQFLTSPGGSGIPIERLHINGDGSVGIGTTTPNSVLDIQGQVGTSTLRLQGGLPYGTYYLDVTPFGSAGAVGYSFNLKSGGSVFGNILNLSPNGNVGIGTSPSTKFHVNGALRIDGATGGVVGSGTGSRIELSTGGTTSIEENWGINLIGNDGSPVKIRNAALLVGYTSATAGWGTGGNLLVQGNAGIGTTTPGAKLDVGAFISGGTLGTVFGRLQEGNSTGTGTFLGVRGYDTQPTNAKSFAIEHSFYGNVNSSINFNRGGGATGGFITFNTDVNTEQIRITNTGYVGIGTTSPDAKLAIKGQVHANEVKVDLSVPGPDYVFEKDYHLTSLEDIKTYIDQNKHLPEVPSAKEMEKNGVQLGEMNMLLLKKIEELTLHTIALHEKMEKISRENQEMRSEMANLKKDK